jgi:hypothetical protein
MWHNKGFVLSALSSTLIISYFVTLTSVLSELIEIYGFSVNEGSYLGTVYLLSGVFGGIVASIILTKY